jgi:hypothetical protein
MADHMTLDDVGLGVVVSSDLKDERTSLIDTDNETQDTA